MTLKELLEKLGSGTARERAARRDGSQRASRQRVKSYGSVSGKGARIDPRSRSAKDKIEKSLG